LETARGAYRSTFAERPETLHLTGPHLGRNEVRLQFEILPGSRSTPKRPHLSKLILREASQHAVSRKFESLASYDRPPIQNADPAGIEAGAVRRRIEIRPVDLHVSPGKRSFFSLKLSHI
jgi:hypothetical protein